MPSVFCLACGLYSFPVSSPRPPRKLPLSPARLGLPCPPGPRTPPGLPCSCRTCRAQQLCSPLCSRHVFRGKSSNFNVLLRRNEYQKRPTLKTGKEHVRQLTQNKNPWSITQRNVDTPSPPPGPTAPGEGARRGHLRGARVPHRPPLGRP